MSLSYSVLKNTNVLPKRRLHFKCVYDVISHRRGNLKTCSSNLFMAY
jgi:hypothetical protein